MTVTQYIPPALPEPLFSHFLYITPSVPFKDSNSRNNRGRKWHLYPSFYTTHQLSTHLPTLFTFVSTTRNYLICDTFSTTFSENITKRTASTTYSFFRHRCALKPITLWPIVKFVVILRRIPIFRHRCALMDIKAQNMTTIC
jgi:hypothetical protein